MHAIVALALIGMAPSAASPPDLQRGHYIVFELDENGIHPQYHRRVTLHGRTSLGAGAADTVPSDREERVRVELVDASGRVAFRDSVPIPRWVRSERPREDGRELEGVVLPAAARAFVVRVPEGPRHLRLRSGALAADFDLEALAADATLGLAGFIPPARVEVERSGSPTNRLDLVILGEGYRAQDAALFTANATEVANHFFSTTPWAQYRSHANVASVATVSAEAGADHPPYQAGCLPGPTAVCCGDPQMLGDPKAGTLVATALDASFCTFNIHRLLTVNIGKAFAAASAYPDWDFILVIVNDSTYGGSGGGSIATASMNAAAVLVAEHEFGHTFGRLADEYETPYPDFPPCSDLVALTCEANVTDQTSRDLVKWAPWIGPTVPLPTPGTPAFDRVVGLFEGARYFPTGFYRPRHDCMMRSLGAPFCEVCRQSVVMLLYGGTWGTPIAGIDPIEPGSESPPPGPVSLSFPGRLDFSAALLTPTRGALSSWWSVNGQRVAGAAGGSFGFVPVAPGSYTVRLDVTDPSTFVHPAIGGTTLDSERTWDVSVTAGGSGVAAAAVDPRSGPAAGGTLVTVRGGGFAPGATVAVGGVPATDVSVIDDRTLEARTPSLAAGARHPLEVSNPGGPPSFMEGAWLADFTDVPQSDLVHPFVERLVRNGITGGCGGGLYCRASAVSRAQMSVFLLRARYGAGFAAPAPAGGVFDDVPTGSFAAGWIEDLFARGVTGGCGTRTYCPSDSISRGAMAVFLLLTKNGTGYQPPPAVGHFKDVPAGTPFAPFIEELARQGITAGCGGGNFCPGAPVTRGEMAVFLSAAFTLP